MKTLLYFFAQKQQKKAREYPAPEPVPDSAVEEFPDLFYKGPGGKDLAMDAFRPVGYSNGKLPVIFMIHGGGLFVGDRKMIGGFCRQLAKRGYLVFSLSYRLLTEADACGEISDICAGFYHAQEILPFYGGDSDRVYLAAESAGVYLGIYALAAQKSDALREKIGCGSFDLRVRKMYCSSGMFYTRRLDLIGLLYPMQIYGKKCLSPSFMKYMNPENPEILLNLPPMLLSSSDADFLDKYTLSYAKALEKAGKKCRLMYYTGNENLTHSYPVYQNGLRESQEVLDEVCFHFFGGEK